MSKIRLLNNWASRQFSMDGKKKDYMNWNKYKIWLEEHGTDSTDILRIESLAEFASKQIKALSKKQVSKK